jgi:hypothetical protein
MNPLPPNLSDAQQQVFEGMYESLHSSLHHFRRTFGFKIEVKCLIALTLDSTFRSFVLNYVALRNAEKANSKMSLEFYFARDDLPWTMFENVVTVQELTACASELGHALYVLVSDKIFLTVEMELGFEPPSVGIVSAMIAPLTNLQDFHLVINEVESMDARQLAPLGASLEYHPFLRSILVWGFDETGLGELCRAAVTVPNLLALNLGGPLDGFTVVTRQDVALAIQQAISVSSLEALWLQKIHFENSQVVQLLANSLAVSEITLLDWDNVMFPVESSEVLATTMVPTRSKISYVPPLSVEWRSCQSGGDESRALLGRPPARTR